MLSEDGNTYPWNEIHCSLHTEYQKHTIHDAFKLLSENKEAFLDGISDEIKENFHINFRKFYDLERKVLGKYEYGMKMFSHIPCQRRKDSSGIIFFVKPKDLVLETELRDFLFEYKKLWKELSELGSIICKPLYEKNNKNKDTVIVFPLSQGW